MLESKPLSVSVPNNVSGQTELLMGQTVEVLNNATTCRLSSPISDQIMAGGVDPQNRLIQGLLICIGYLPATFHVGDTNTPVVRSAITLFQADNGISPTTGTVNSATQEKMNVFVK